MRRSLKKRGEGKEKDREEDERKERRKRRRRRRKEEEKEATWQQQQHFKYIFPFFQEANSPPPFLHLLHHLRPTNPPSSFFL